MVDKRRYVDVIINDLKNKIDEISKAGEGATGDTLIKINDIKTKAIEILTQASNKVIDTTNDIADDEEIEKIVAIVTSKSKQLYDNALNKIDELTKPENVKKAKKVVNDVNDVKKDINDFFEREEVKNTIESAKEVTVDIAEKALDTLKDWLKTEE